MVTERRAMAKHVRRYAILCAVLVPTVCVLLVWFCRARSAERSDRWEYPVAHGTHFVDNNGRVVIAGPFEDTQQFSEGLAAVRIGGTFGFIDPWGQIRIRPRFDDAMGFAEGLAPVTIAGKIGFIDRSGEVIIGARFELAYPFSCGLAPYREGGRWGFIDRTGTAAFPATFDEARSFSEGFAAVSPAAGQWGYINVLGEFVIAPRAWTPIGEFTGGVAKVRVNGRVRVINWRGDFVD